jgi:hypothetical protein
MEEKRSAHGILGTRGKKKISRENEEIFLSSFPHTRIPWAVFFITDVTHSPGKLF